MFWWRFCIWLLISFLLHFTLIHLLQCIILLISLDLLLQFPSTIKTLIKNIDSEFQGIQESPDAMAILTLSTSAINNNAIMLLGNKVMTEEMNHKKM